MVKGKLVIWPQMTRMQLREIYKYIKKDSVQNAEKVRKEILAATSKLATAPKVYQSDKYKMGNDGSFRAFEIHRYRIAYHIGKDKITIVRIIHTSRQPKKY